MLGNSEFPKSVRTRVNDSHSSHVASRILLGHFSFFFLSSFTEDEFRCAIPILVPTQSRASNTRPHRLAHRRQALAWTIFIIFLSCTSAVIMGQMLSVPSTRKSTDSGENDQVFYTLVSMQGWRIRMEDAHTIVLDLEAAGGKQNCFFAVYDGHGGSTVAKFAGLNVHKRLVTEEAYKNDDYETALKNAFLGTDEDILTDPAHTRDPSGCTAVAALLTHDNKIYVANAGDSRSVLGVKGQVEPLSFDHKPTNDGERARILGAGGYVERGRVNGNLALSRSLGDFEFKKNSSLGPQAQIITANPDVTCHEIMEDDEFFVLACDGIWDCLSSQDVVNFVRYQVSQGKELTEIGEMICDHCLAPDTSLENDIGCDNMTILIVAITHGRSKKKWYAWIKDRVKKNYGYQTPSTLPRIYAESRLMAFRAKKESYDRQNRALEEKYSAQPNASTSALSAPTRNLEEQRLTENISEAHDSSLEHAGTDGDTLKQKQPSKLFAVLRKIVLQFFYHLREIFCLLGRKVQ